MRFQILYTKRTSQATQPGQVGVPTLIGLDCRPRERVGKEYVYRYEKKLEAAPSKNSVIILLCLPLVSNVPGRCGTMHADPVLVGKRKNG